MERISTAFIISIYVSQITCEASLKCPANEILDMFKNPCQPTCKRPVPPKCEFLVCQPGCICQPGYLRDESTNLCVLPCDCPAECPPNEERNFNQQKCEQTCQNYPKGVECSIQAKQCICKAGFLRDLESGKCVPLGNCPRLCGVNQEWRNCSDKLCRLTCQNMNNPPICMPNCNCEPGCSCKEGFIWDEETQMCIRKELCPKQCPVNEIYNCKQQQCESTCPGNSSGLECYSKIKDCVCQVGFLRDLSTGKCVPLDHCPQQCGENEKWNACTNPACKRTCQNRFQSGRFCPLLCIPACECKEGYIWDETSKKCVLETECPPYVCGINEEWKNCSDKRCRKSCQNLGQTIPPCLGQCEPGCDCKPGFIWDENTLKCIPIDKCPIQCPTNELYNCKEQYCEPSCQNQPSGLQCYIKPPKCICKAGFYRDTNSGKCVFSDQCPKVCGINEKWTNCSDEYCRRTCQNKGQIVNCPLILCKPGCTCKEGFIWDTNSNQCIPEYLCPPVCGVNEEWTNCSDKYCRRTCQNRGQFLSCPYVCKPGCSCKKGFIWDDNSNQCISENLCPAVCGINEEWKECSDILCRRTCQNRGQALQCPKICQAGCSCKPGFIWDDNSKQCIPEDLCPKLECSYNEVENYNGDYCEVTCQEQSSSLKCYSQPKKCICKVGYSRDLVSGKCVASETCPKVCKKNEVWDTCKNPFCKKTCQNRCRTDIICPAVCVAGCRCTDGYIWDEVNGTCVPEYLCPVNECGINEEWVNCSDKYCRKSCQNMNQILSCPRVPCIPGCVCKKGFIWNEETQKCIPQWQCPKTCGINEVWKECSDVNCRKTCQREKPKVCLDVCIPGCSCKDGYIWDEYLQKCVDKCYNPQVCGNNQEWCTYVPEDYPTCQNILRQNSYNIFNPTIVKFKPGCKCKKGYVWDENCKKCVLPIQCSGF